MLVDGQQLNLIKPVAKVPVDRPFSADPSEYSDLREPSDRAQSDRATERRAKANTGDHHEETGR